MKHLLCLIGFFIFVTSCNKSYKYIEIVEERDFISGELKTKEKDPEIIYAESDSAAYCEAYQRFCIALKVRNDMLKEGIGEVATPTEFKLFDEQDNNIALSVSFTNTDSILGNIYKKVMELPSTVSSDYTILSNEQHSIDSVKIKFLEQYFNKEKDEFDTDGRIWYKTKSCPKYANRNGIYVYFATKDNIPEKLRFRVQYYADNWLFFKKISFSIDGKAFDYIPLRTETDSGNGGKIWEWSDEAITNENDKELLNALSTAKSAKMKFMGTQYYDIKTISKSQIEDIKRTLELYKAMGGVF